jgi:hypothetical protein
MREENTSRMMAADRPYDEFYDFYSVILEFFEFTFVYPFDTKLDCPYTGWWESNSGST